jgi:hypothetical protein
MTEAPNGDHHSQSQPERPKVLYVMGSGHSGSTILGVTLGNCEGVFYAGELDNWLTRSGVSVLGGLERTHFWSAVREDVSDPESLFNGDAKVLLERSSAILRIDKRGPQRAMRKRYRRITEDLYRAIARQSGAEYVVDTSHFPLRARELQALPGIDLYIVFLIRDPQAVVSSFTVDVNRNERAARWFRVFTTNADLWLTHLLSIFVYLRQPRDRRMLVRHEQFLADPTAVLREILDRIQSDAALPDLSALKTGFPIQGNRLIRSDMVALKSRPVERQTSSRASAVLQWPFEEVFSRLEAAARNDPSAGSNR